MSLHGLTLTLEITAAALAVVCARKHSEHRPVAAFLAGAVATDLTRLALQEWIIRPAREALLAAGIEPATVPLTGWPRVAFHLDSALFLSWFAALAALSLWVFLRRRPWPVAIVHGLAVTALVLSYPTIRYDTLLQFYLAAQLATLTVGLGALGPWLGRASPRLPQVVTSCILMVDLAGIVAGPWRFGLFGAAWSFAQVMYSALYAVLIVVQTGALWTSPSFSR